MITITGVYFVNEVNKMNENMKEALSRYNTISVINETGIIVPMLLANVAFFVIIPFMWSTDLRDAWTVLALMFTFCFIPLYLYIFVLVGEYNRFLSRSIIITDVEIQNISYIESRNKNTVALFTVQYKYTAPDGQIYKKTQKVQLFNDYFEPNQRKLWMSLLQSDRDLRDLHVIVDNEDYSKSYFPLYEEYCIAFKRRYAVHLLYWDRKL